MDIVKSPDGFSFVTKHQGVPVWHWHRMMSVSSTVACVLGNFAPPHSFLQMLARPSCHDVDGDCLAEQITVRDHNGNLIDSQVVTSSNINTELTELQVELSEDGIDIDQNGTFLNGSLFTGLNIDSELEENDNDEIDEELEAHDLLEGAFTTHDYIFAAGINLQHEAKNKQLIAELKNVISYFVNTVRMSSPMVIRNFLDLKDWPRHMRQFMSEKLPAKRKLASKFSMDKLVLKSANKETIDTFLQKVTKDQYVITTKHELENAIDTPKKKLMKALLKRWFVSPVKGKMKDYLGRGM